MRERILLCFITCRSSFLPLAKTGASISSKNPRPTFGPVAWFTAFYLLAAAVAAGIVRNTEFIFYIVIMLVLCGVVAVVHFRTNLSRPLLWCLSVWGLAHMAGGLVPVPESWPIDGDIRVLYSAWLGPVKYDQVVHAYGFGITTWACWEGLRSMFPAARPTVGALTLCGTAGMGFGALNEVVEFAATQLMESTNVGGYVNTGWDLVSNLTGCCVALVIIRLRSATD